MGYGYPSARSARTAAETYAAVLAASPDIFVAGETEGLPPLDGVTGVVLIGRDQAKVDPARLTWLREAWLAGMPVLADNALAPLLGAFYSAHGPTPKDAEQAEIATQKSFRLGGTQVEAGLGLLDVTLEPQLLNDNRWGRFFQGAEVIGANVAFLLDLRRAALAAGESGGFVIANGLLDVFAAGEAVRPQLADMAASPTRVATPALPPVAPAPALTPTATPSPAPTATVLPTSMPAPSPTPAPPAVTPQAAATGSAPPVRLAGLGVILVALAVVLFLAVRRRRS